MGTNLSRRQQKLGITRVLKDQTSALQNKEEPVQNEEEKKKRKKKNNNGMQHGGDH